MEVQYHQHIASWHALNKAVRGCRHKCDVLIDENRQLRKDLQEQETEMFKVSQKLNCFHGRQITSDAQSKV